MSRNQARRRTGFPPWITRMLNRCALRAGRAGAGSGLTVLLTVLAGCAHYQAHPIVPEQAAQMFSARTLNDDGLREFMRRAAAERGQTGPITWPLPDWDLDALTLAGDYFQPSLAVARAQWDVGKAATITAGERPNPSISASGTYDTTTPPPWIPAVSFDIPIETAGKRGYRIDQARAQAEALRWDLVDKAWQVRTAVRSALLDLYNARQTAALLARQEAAQTRQLRLLEEQLRAGAVAQAEVTPARVTLDTTRLSRAQARTDETKALAALASAIGVPTAALQQVQISFKGFESFPAAPAPNDARRLAVLNRADVRSALASYAATQAALQLEVANQYPDIHLGPGYEYDQTDNKWTLGLTLELPIFNQHRGPIAEAEAKRRLVAAQFVEVQAKALSETDTAFAVYSSAIAQANTAAALERGLRQRLASARQMEQAGEIEPLAVAAAEVEYASGEVQHLNALINAQQALGALESALQDPAIVPPNTIEQSAPLSHEP